MCCCSAHLLFSLQYFVSHTIKYKSVYVYDVKAHENVGVNPHILNTGTNGESE